MRRRDNFYFYFSIASLLFIFILIYYFYEMDYKLSKFLDIKTIFLVLGTLGGAFLGAYFAAKNTEKNIRNQIAYQELKEIEKASIELSKIHLDVKYELDYFEEYFFHIEKIYLNKFEQKYTVSIDISISHITERLFELKSINLSKYDYKLYKIIKEFIGKVELLITNLEFLKLHLSVDNKEEYFIHLENYKKNAQRAKELGTDFSLLINLPE